MNCKFCLLREQKIVEAQPLALLMLDTFPLSPGHMLVIPRRHVASLFDTTNEERLAMLELLDHAKAVLEKKHQPDGYNIGINDGAAAGQSIPHLHVHVIPRYAGDVENPRGGVRWVIPEKAPYWKTE